MLFLMPGVAICLHVLYEWYLSVILVEKTWIIFKVVYSASTGPSIYEEYSIFTSYLNVPLCVCIGTDRWYKTCL